MDAVAGGGGPPGRERLFAPLAGVSTLLEVGQLFDSPPSGGLFHHLGLECLFGGADPAAKLLRIDGSAGGLQFGG
jgi:hypothetical protein